MQLWNDLEDNSQLPTTRGRGRLRRLTEPIVFASLREWLLHEYVADYCHSLAATRIFKRCYFVDGLGGIAKGRKTSTTSTTPSALEQVEALARALAQANRPIALYSLLLTAGSSRARAGRAKEPTLPETGGMLNTSWVEIAPQVVQKIDQSPAIFLLNPFGHTMFTSDDLALLYKRTAPTELCLLLSHKQVETQFLNATLSPVLATTFTATLRTDRWKTLSTEENERKKTISNLIDLFVASLQKHFVLPIQQITLPLLTRPGVVEDIPYTLVFATRRQDSFASMNDALCRYQRMVYEQRHRGVLSEEWFERQYRERVGQERVRLQETLVQQGRAQRIRRWPDLRLQVLQANFGRFLLHDYDMLLQQLIAEGEVRVEWRSLASEREEQRLPGNDDVLQWNVERNVQKERGGTRGKH
jgi:hypothetical protein